MTRHAESVGDARLRRIAGALLVVSSVTHVAQLAVYSAEAQVVGAAAFGSVYLGIGLLLLRGSRVGAWLGMILPAVGGMGGVLRFLFVHRNPFSVLHVTIDLVVVPVCAYLLFRDRRRA